MQTSRELIGSSNCAVLSSCRAPFRARLSLLPLLLFLHALTLLLCLLVLLPVKARLIFCLHLGFVIGIKTPAGQRAYDESGNKDNRSHRELTGAGFTEGLLLCRCARLLRGRLPFRDERIYKILGLFAAPTSSLSHKCDGVNFVIRLLQCHRYLFSLRIFVRLSLTLFLCRHCTRR